MVVSAIIAAEKSLKRYPGEAKGFVAMKLHTRDQAKEGEKEPQGKPVAKWEPSVFWWTANWFMTRIVEKADFPEDSEFRNTGLERSEMLAKDLEWFKEQGHEPSSPGVSYALTLEELSKKDPQAFICHFYNIYFAHSAGG